MTTPANIQLQISVNLGAFTAGGILIASGNDINLWIADRSGVKTIRFEIYSYPAGFTCPAGWSTDANGVYFIISNGALVDAGNITVWGKYLCRATVNGGMRNGVVVPDLIDEVSAFEIVSPVLGLHDIAYLENGQFGARAYIATLQAAFRAIEQVGGGDSRDIVTTSTATTTLVNTKNVLVLVDSATGARTVKLPAAPSPGQEVTVLDRDNNASSNNITIDRNGSQLDGGTSNETITTNRGSKKLIWTNANTSSLGWRSV